MRRLSLVALLGIAVLMVPLIMAQAASLDVNGGVLQAWAFDLDIEPPPTVDVSVELAEYAGNSGNRDEKNGSRTLGYTLVEGRVYFVIYDRPNQVRDCPTSVPAPNSQTTTSFTASQGLTYVLCVQKSQDGGVTVRAGAADGPVVEPTTTSTAANTSLSVPGQPPSELVEGQTSSRTVEPAVQPEESPVSPPESIPTPEGTAPHEPEVPVIDRPSASPEPTTPASEPTTTATEKTSPAPEKSSPAPEKSSPAPEETSPAPEETSPAPETTSPAPTPPPCAWEVREDDEGETYLVEICPDDATESVEDEGTS